MRASPKHEREALGAKLSALRLARGMNQTKAAQAIGVSPRCISFWESGERLPHTPDMWRICRFYGVTFESLVGDIFEGAS
jgi:transcriptional regulator with XRE-family HTH domain